MCDYTSMWITCTRVVTTHSKQNASWDAHTYLDISNFSAFHETQRPITMFTTAHQRSTSWTRCIQHRTPHKSSSLILILLFTFHLVPDIPSDVSALKLICCQYDYKVNCFICAGWKAGKWHFRVIVEIDKYWHIINSTHITCLNMCYHSSLCTHLMYECRSPVEFTSRWDMSDCPLVVTVLICEHCSADGAASGEDAANCCLAPCPASSWHSHLHSSGFT